MSKESLQKPIVIDLDKYKFEQVKPSKTFLKNVQYKNTDGYHEYSCIKSLWSVGGKDRDYVFTESIGLFQQYFNEGEYD